MNSLRGPIILFSLIATSANAQSLFEYRVPKLESMGNDSACEARIAEIGSRFSKATGASIISSSCASIDHDPGLYSGTITYSAQEEVATSRTMDPYSVGLDLMGNYPSLQACEADQSRQDQLFTKATGLTPFVSYCYRATRASTSPAVFAVQIEALGHSEVRKFIGGIDIVSSVSRGIDHLVRQIDERMLALPVTTVAVDLARKQLWHEVRIEYYATQRWFFDLNFQIKYESAGFCQRDAGLLGDDFLAASSYVLGAYCEFGNGLNGNRFAVATAAPTASRADAALDFKILKSNYASRNSCEADLGSLRRTLEGQGLAVTALMCGFDDDRFVSYVFIKKR